MKNLMIILTFLYTYGFAQDVMSSSEYKIEDVRDKYSRITKIIYNQIGNDTITNIIDPVDFSPYLELSYTKKTKQFAVHQKEVYDLSKENKYDIFDKYFSNSEYPDSLIHLLNFDFALVETTIETFRNYRFLIFSLKFYNDEICLLGVNTTAFVINPNGIVLSKFSNITYGFTAAVITIDENFIAFLSDGDELSFCYSAYPQSTVLIYDLLSDQIVYKASNVSPPFIPENGNYIALRDNIKGGFQYKIIFPEQKCFYTKEYNRKEKYIIQFAVDGLIVKDKKQNKIVKEIYENSFIKKTF